MNLREQHHTYRTRPGVTVCICGLPYSATVHSAPPFGPNDVAIAGEGERSGTLVLERTP